MISTLVICSTLAAAPSEMPDDIAAAASTEFSFAFDPAGADASPRMTILPEEPVEQFGIAGYTSWLANLAGATDLDTDHFVRGGVGISHFIANDFSVDLELNLGYFATSGDDAAGINFNLLFRWHFWHDESRTWTVYADAGAGILGTTDDVPATGSQFNFTPQAGMGASFDIGDNRRLYVGARWHHISNANLFDNNPGEDYGMLYVMLGWKF